MVNIYQELIKIQCSHYPYYVRDISGGVEIISKIQADLFIIVYDNKLDIKNITRLVNEVKGISNTAVLSVFAHESMKTSESLMNIINFAFDNNVTSNSVLIAVGGGVLTDICGLAASMIYRGIKLVCVPTTVIAAADSTISLKHAVNSTRSKNGIGVFYKPYAIVTITEFFDTLPQREYKAGLVESVKNVLCISPDSIGIFQNAMMNGVQYTYDELEFIIKCALEDKMKVLKDDMEERKSGLVLEYGHGVGHVVELYSKGEVNHGEGVAFGMLVMSRVSHDLGCLSSQEVELHETLLNQIGVMAGLRQIKQIPSDEILRCLMYDNKRGYLRADALEFPMVVLERLGKCLTEADVNLIRVHKSLLIKNIEQVQRVL